MYPGPASNVLGIQPRTQLSSAFFIPDEMRNDILSRNEISNLVDTNPNSGEFINPFAIIRERKLNRNNCYIHTDLEEIDNYHSLYPLETPPSHSKLILTSTYKATHNSTGIKYCLRRLHGMVLFLLCDVKRKLMKIFPSV